jgi:hypothetical protein
MARPKTEDFFNDVLSYGIIENPMKSALVDREVQEYSTWARSQGDR